jgi:NACHT domain
MIDPFITWLVEGGVGPALVALPVNLVTAEAASSATRWFRRVRHEDDLSRLVKAATGAEVELAAEEFSALRRMLEDPHTWALAGRGTVDDLTSLVACHLPARGNRTAAQTHATAAVIARGILETAIADLDPALFRHLLVARLQRIEEGQASALDETLFELQGDLIAGFTGMMEQFSRILERLPTKPAGRGEVAIYLTALIDWLNTDPWPRDRRFSGPVLTPAALERKMRVNAKGRAGEQDMDADLLARQCKRLVILGDPGSGKTWLAKRVARKCAEDALAALAQGELLAEVELPLFTTCSRLFNTAGDIRSAAVSSAFEQFRDLGGSRISSALRLFFTERNTQTLLVIDSLDEAVGSDERLRQADTLPWRIILTSRPSSWNEQVTLDEESGAGRVGYLRPLSYPDDVVHFIRHWFAEHSAWGDDLAAEIARRPSVQQAATVPLILAFYCIIGGDQKLPESRRDLYAKVVNRMLTGRWRGSNDGDLDQVACLRALRSWAWSGAISDPLSGLGAWPDEIPVENPRLGHSSGDALEHVAAPLGMPDVDTGLTLRRFVHRSIREHLVAEHVAGLSVDQATETLLPHLWFDTDWEYATPAAIAMHPQREELLVRLICRAACSGEMPADLARIDAHWEFRGLLSQVASQSSEDDWSPEIAALISRSMLELAQSGNFYDLRGTGHWNTTSQVRKTLLSLLASQTDLLDATILAQGLVELAPSAEETRQARGVLLDMLSSQEIYGRLLAEALAQLGASEKDMRRARGVQLGKLAKQTDRWHAANLAEELIELAPTADERRQARKILLALLAGEYGYPEDDNVVKQLVRLAPSAAEKSQARAALLRILADGTDSWKTAKLVKGMFQLEASAEEKRRARELLIGHLTRGTDRDAVQLLQVLIQLDPPSQEMRPVHETLISFLSQTSGCSDIHKVARGLVELGASVADKDRARKLVLKLLLSQTDRRRAALLAQSLIQLDPPAEERRQARETLLRLLPAPNDRQEAAALIEHMGNSMGGTTELREFVRGFVLLDPTEEDNRWVRGVLLMLLASPADWHPRKCIDWAGMLVEELAKLNPPLEDKHRAGKVLLSILASPTDSREVTQLLERVLSQEPLEDKRRAGEALLKISASQINGREASHLVEQLLSLDPSAEDKHKIREVLLLLMASTTDTSQAGYLALSLGHLNVTASDLSRCQNWATSPPRALLAAARQNSKLDDWLAALPMLPANFN